MENNKNTESVNSNTKKFNLFGVINSCFFGLHKWGKWQYIGAGLQVKTCLKCNKKKSNCL